MDWTAVAPLIAAGAAMWAALLASQTAKRSIELNAEVARDQKDREHRLAHQKELAKKRLDVFDEFAVLASDAIHGLADEKSIVDDYRTMDQFRGKWLGKKVYYYWLSQTAKDKYDDISVGFSRVEKVYWAAREAAGEAGAEVKFGPIFTEQFGAFYKDLQEFINQLGHDYEFLSEEDLKKTP